MTKETQAALVVAKAAEVAAETAERVAEAAATRIAHAVKAAAESVAIASQVQASAAQTTAAVVTSRLDAMEKRYDKHEETDRQRFDDVIDGQKDLKHELREEIKEIAIDQKKQTKVLAGIMGGLVVLSKIPDLISFLHH